MRISSTARNIAIALFVAGVSGCMSERPPSKAELVRNMPVSSLDQALNVFKAVCLDGATDPQSPAFMFDYSSTKNGQNICSLRARGPQGFSAFSELQRRYGSPKTMTLVSAFDAYPYGRLLFIPGIEYGAGEGTYQIGIVR